MATSGPWYQQMRFLRIVLPVAVLTLVTATHYQWSMSGGSASPCAGAICADCAPSKPSYLADGGIWLGLSYGLAGAFVVLCLVHMYEDRRRSVAGAVGGLTPTGFLYIVGCFLLGCCGSPMLGIYLALLGPRFLGAAKPLVFVITALSVVIGYVWLTRRKGEACGCADSCCGDSSSEASAEGNGQKPYWVAGAVETPAGHIPRVATELRFADRLGTVKARLAIGRMHYSIGPGLYAVGSPTADSPVFVTANYKMSLDSLRSALTGRNGWIIVLDTNGINVWCAAGKGTFGTEELVNRIQATSLDAIVSHRRLIVPQLGAPGVAAHEVKKRSGFRVVYGPARADDLPAFLDAGREATPEMRRVTFTMRERLVLTPVELMLCPRAFLWGLVGLFLLGGLSRQGYSFDHSMTIGLRAVTLCVAAFLCGSVVTPILLPWLPGRAFAVKGALVGLALAIGNLLLRDGLTATGGPRLELIAWFFILPAASAFFAMNFTGASNVTSLSGVRREVRVATPVMVAAAVIGVALWTASLVV